MSDAVERLRGDAARRPTERPFPTVGQTRRALDEVRKVQPPPLVGGHPWVPGDGAESEAAWRARIGWYVAIDDLGDGEVVFSAVRWPTLDERHRLVFDDPQPTVFARPLAAAQAFVNANRSMADDAGLRDRELRVGDVFAMSDGALDGLQGTGSGDDSVVILDVTAASREQAKIAFYAAATRTLDPTHDPDHDLAATIWHDRKLAGDEGREQ